MALIPSDSAPQPAGECEGLAGVAAAGDSFFSAGVSVDPVAAERPRWPDKLFAVVSTLLMILVTFQVLAGPVAALVRLPVPAVASAAPPGFVYGNGVAATVDPGNAVQFSNLATFERWDGAVLPLADLNRSNGNWPYQVDDSGSFFEISKDGYEFTQGKIDGATYAYQTDSIQELIVLAAPPAAQTSPSITTTFTTTYQVTTSGDTVTLWMSPFHAAWMTSPYRAWDSSEPRQTWTRPIASAAYSHGHLILSLSPEMLSTAKYPVYIDPTWTLTGSIGWGLSTFAGTTTDIGDGSVKLGNFADDFNNNAPTGWATSGTVTFSGGTMTISPVSYAIHTAGWTDFNTQFDMNFASYHSSIGDALFLDLGVTSVGSSSIWLEVLQSAGTVYMTDQVSGWQLSFTTTISTGTWYTARVSAEGNTYQVYWNGVLMLTGTDSRTRPAGGIDFDRGSAPATVSVDNVRVWNANSGSITTPIRNAGSYRPLQTEVFGTVDSYNQMQMQIRSSPNNSTWGPWTNLKADVAASIPFAEPDQTQQQYYQLQIVLTSGVNGTPSLTQITTTEGTPTVSPITNTGMEPWYPYADGVVNLVNGNLVVSRTDIAFQGKGFTLAITRTYNSFLASYNGSFGAGWTFTYGQSLTISPTGNVTWLAPDGAEFIFVAKGSTGGFAPPRGVPDRLVKNSDGTYTLWMTDGNSNHFSSVGLLLSMSDRNGNQLTMSYSGGKTPLLTTVADATGRALSFAYDKSHRIVTVTDPASRVVTYTYASAFNGLTLVTDPAGDWMSYDYYQGNYLAATFDEVGRYEFVNYVTGNPPTSGQVSNVWLEYDSPTHFRYWQYRDFSITYNSTTTRAFENARGFWTTITLNSFGNAISVNGPAIGCGCDAIGNSSGYVWDGEMNRISATDGRGDAWSMAYGYRGNLLSTTDPGLNVSSESWTETNSAAAYFVVPASSTTYRGFTTTLTYDSRGNLLSRKDPGGNITQYAYDANGYLNKTVSPRQFTTWYVYNASGELVKEEDNLSEATTYTYDILGRQTGVISPLGFVTTTSYDADGRVVKTIDPLLHATSYSYDARGDLLNVTDPDQLTTRSTVNVTNGLVQTSMDSGGNVTRRTYDLTNNLVALENANLYTTTYAYDRFNRLSTTTTPLGYVTKYVYDAAGNRIARTDGNGYTTRYVYDKLNRMAHTMYPGAPVYANPQTLSFAYDKDGNMVSAAGFGYTETHGYDGSDRLAWLVFNYGTYSVTTKYTYDSDGNKATMTLGSTVTTYTYDQVGRLSTMKDPEGQTTSFGYDRDSRQVKETDPSGVVTTWIYDQASRLLAMYTNSTSGAGATVLESFIYGYDNAGYRTYEKDVQGTTTTITTYVYDMVHRLYKTVQGSVTTIDTYDADGNVLSESTTTYSYDSDDELADVYWSGTLRISYQYDRDGNRKSSFLVGRGSGDTWAYDYENRLISSSGGCNYTYSPTGERVSSTCSTGTTNLVYDQNTAGGSNLLAAYTASGTQTARYLDGSGLNSATELYTGGNHYAYQTDGIGSVRMVTGASQNATDTYAYDAWGNPVSQSGTLTNPLEYTGSIFQPDSVQLPGFYDERARFYDPSTNGGHSFLSQDSMGGGYAYVGDAPLNFVDSTGRMRYEGPTGGGGGGGGAAASAPPCTLDEQLDSGCPGTPTYVTQGTPSSTTTTTNPGVSFNWKCMISIALFAGGLVAGFLGIWFDAQGIETAAPDIMSLGLDWAGIASGADWGAILSLLVDLAGIIFNLWSQSADWLAKIMWAGENGAKLTPFGIAIEVGAFVDSIATGLPGVIHDCTS